MTENSQNVCDTVITRDDTIEDNIDFVNLKTIIYIIPTVIDENTAESIFCPYA
jgi:hypothetical protein|tara:strand:+ start:222 stop:380 length:159 start_codon:yes stop_codon:yes gene_type:complete